jgi:ABC-2 type transport system ATP-binding protein
VGLWYDDAHTRSIDEMNAVTIKNLKKVYANGVQALKSVDLEVAEGDFFALLGPNGAGKTTIIGTVVGLVTKTEGSVQIFDKDIDKDPERSREFIGIVPQEFNFNIFEKNINTVVNQAGYYGIPRDVAVPRAEEMFKKLGLSEKRDDIAFALSGGMKRRLMIARALVHQPKLLILDEPTAGVDIELRRGMWDFLQDLNKNGTTIILTTHYLEEAEQLCKNVAIINKGNIVLQSPMRELLAKPQNESFTVYVTEPVVSEKLQKLEHCDIKELDPTTLEVTLHHGTRLNDFILQLANAGIEIQSMRNKSNKLEEVYLSLTGADSQ